jgi:hypothetical protein
MQRTTAIKIQREACACLRLDGNVFALFGVDGGLDAFLQATTGSIDLIRLLMFFLYFASSSFHRYRFISLSNELTAGCLSLRRAPFVES